MPWPGGSSGALSKIDLSLSHGCFSLSLKKPSVNCSGQSFPAFVCLSSLLSNLLPWGILGPPASKTVTAFSLLTPCLTLPSPLTAAPSCSRASGGTVRPATLSGSNESWEQGSSSQHAVLRGPERENRSVCPDSAKAGLWVKLN